jgi:hypothetical protein
LRESFLFFDFKIITQEEKLGVGVFGFGFDFLIINFWDPRRKNGNAGRQWDVHPNGQVQTVLGPQPESQSANAGISENPRGVKADGLARGSTKACQ